MIRNILSMLFLLAGTIFSSLQAQTAYDALRFSFYPEPGGTARTVGIGGGIGAFGADFSTLSGNPAGLASYRRSEFSFSPEIYSIKTKSLLLGKQENQLIPEDRSSLNVNNVGFVIAGHPSNSSWKTLNFGIGLNRMATYTQSIYFSGTSPGSITDRFLEKATGLESSELDGFEEGLAYDVGAIYPDQNNPGEYFSDFYDGEEVDKQQVVKTQGSVSEMVFSLAANYEEKLQLGMTVGVPFLSFTEDKTYTETDEGNQNPVFNELSYQEYVRLNGTGINLKLGMIYKPTHAIRIGLALHTPTSFSLEDSYSTSMVYDYFFDGNNRYEQSSPEGFYEYRLRTPWRVIGSTGLLFKKAGFLTAEVEWADYSTAAFNFTNATTPADKDYQRQLNREISTAYTSSFIVRLGGEAVMDIFRIRAGYNFITSPYVGETYTRGIWSAGFGVREKGFFLDLAYRRGITEGSYFPYLTSDRPQPEVETKTTVQHFLLTLGFNF
ncbi:MAG: hypothetical protein IPL49_01830 [Saprospirales bacterium]|nr:hypothetical protein [Saprospirales bacterium]